jgi:hypothetical protein
MVLEVEISSFQTANSSQIDPLKTVKINFKSMKIIGFYQNRENEYSRKYVTVTLHLIQ